jgi:hypothetical protein
LKSEVADEFKGMSRQEIQEKCKRRKKKQEEK